MEMILTPPGDIWRCLETVLVVPMDREDGSGGATVAQWVEAKDAPKHPTAYGAAPTTRTHPQMSAVWVSRSPAVV